ncbi:MAG: hypothetical protein PVI86_12435, partial [Phycisphaerae bacterium]
MTTATATELQRIIDSALRGELDEATADRIHAFGREAVTLFALALNRRLAELQGTSRGEQVSPSTPSGMVPVYAKPNKLGWTQVQISKPDPLFDPLFPF